MERTLTKSELEFIDTLVKLGFLKQEQAAHNKRTKESSKAFQSAMKKYKESKAFKDQKDNIHQKQAVGNNANNHKTGKPKADQHVLNDSSTIYWQIITQKLSNNCSKLINFLGRRGICSELARISLSFFIIFVLYSLVAPKQTAYTTADSYQQERIDKLISNAELIVSKTSHNGPISNDSLRNLEITLQDLKSAYSQLSMVKTIEARGAAVKSCLNGINTSMVSVQIENVSKACIAKFGNSEAGDDSFRR